MTAPYSQQPAECGCCGDVFEGYGNLCGKCNQSGCSGQDDIDCYRGDSQ